jgi:RpiR family carbohydrate utilization transcriptional regulator
MDIEGRSETRGLNSRNIIEVIRTMRPELRKSDRKVADVVLEDPHRIMNATVSETATLADVNPLSCVLQRQLAVPASRI